MKPYTPIDLPITLPDIDDIIEYCKAKSKSPDSGFEDGMICVIGTMLPLNDYRSGADAYDADHRWRQFDDDILIDATTNSKHLGSFYFDRDFDLQFPELVEGIKKLPFLHLTGAFILMSGLNRPSELHQDQFPLRDYPLSITSAEPSRYNIQLNQFDDPKFFLQNDSEKIYVKVTSEYPCFAFDNSNYHHGADSSDTHRYQILLYGILQEETHQRLIKHSIEKFGE